MIISENCQSCKIIIPETGESFIKSYDYTIKFKKKADRIGLKYSVEILN